MTNREMSPPGHSYRLPAVCSNQDWRGGGKGMGESRCTPVLSQRKGDFSTWFPLCLGNFKSFFYSGRLRALPAFNSLQAGKGALNLIFLPNSHLNAKPIEFLRLSLGCVSLPPPLCLCPCPRPRRGGLASAPGQSPLLCILVPAEAALCLSLPR